MGYVGMNSSYMTSNPITKIHAPLLEAWRAAARGPDHWVHEWLTIGAPAGILRLLQDPGIFPDCTSPSEQRPEDMYCDEHNFRNYSGVEEHEVTAAELQGHIDAGHLAEFDSYEELASYVGGKPILNKIGLIIKVRGGVSKARMILDTKESGLKRITTKTQRVTLPNLSMQSSGC